MKGTTNTDERQEAEYLVIFIKQGEDGCDGSEEVEDCSGNTILGKEMEHIYFGVKSLTQINIESTMKVFIVN